MQNKNRCECIGFVFVTNALPMAEEPKNLPCSGRQRMRRFGGEIKCRAQCRENILINKNVKRT